jgi:hypothetical protein
MEVTVDAVAGRHPNDASTTKRISTFGLAGAYRRPTTDYSCPDERI